MIELVTAYSLKDIITFLVILALAIKGVISYGEWLKEKITGVVHKKNKTEQLKKDVEEMKERQVKMEHDIALLIRSSILDFRFQLVKEHHYFSQLGWIDAYSLAALEEQYAVYIEEGGNSFAKQLMEEIRALSKQQPSENTKEDE